MKSVMALRLQNDEFDTIHLLMTLEDKLRARGQQVYNLSIGQLPFAPDLSLKDEMTRQLQCPRSFLYSPILGFQKLREKLMNYAQQTRGLRWERDQFDCAVCTGAKQALFNLLATIVNPDDQIILLAPYWVSYPKMIRYWGGQPVIVDSMPSSPPPIANIVQKITHKTKAIIINTPNNPAGIYYQPRWIEEFAQLMLAHPHLQIISDEVYFSLSYDRPGPRYPYQYYPELLSRTYIIDSISKSMSCPGLRVGFCFGNKQVIQAMGKIQEQSTSSANSLVQQALIEYDFFNGIQDYLTPIKNHLRSNSALLKTKLEQYGLSRLWYPTNGSFYFFLSFQDIPAFQNIKMQNKPPKSLSTTLCTEIANKTGVIMFPGDPFGLDNGARMSFSLWQKPFAKALDKVFGYLSA